MHCPNPKLVELMKLVRSEVERMRHDISSELSDTGKMHKRNWRW